VDIVKPANWGTGELVNESGRSDSEPQAFIHRFTGSPVHPLLLKNEKAVSLSGDGLGFSFSGSARHPQIARRTTTPRTMRRMTGEEFSRTGTLRVWRSGFE
jgi:hypothetical protein